MCIRDSPLTQQRAPRLTLALRSALPATSLAPLVREVLHAEAPDLAVLPLQPSSARLLNALLPQRAGGAIASALGGAAALLAALGLYALLAHQVAASRREIGVRIALGAEPKRIISQFVKRGIRFG